MKTQKLRLSRIVMNFLLLVYAVFAIFPLIWMLLISFKSDTEVFTTTFLFHPTLSNYTAVLLESNYVQYMKDSLIVAGGSVLVSVSPPPMPWPGITSTARRTWPSRSCPSSSPPRSWWCCPCS